MQGVKRSSRAASKGGVFERVYSGLEKSGRRAGYSTLWESSPTSIRSDRGYPRSFKGYLGVQEERGTGHSAGRRFPRRATLREEVEVHSGTLAFNVNDLEGTIQPHDDALVVTARINGFIVKRVLIDQGNGAEVMYPDLFGGLGLKNEDFSKYDMPLVGFDSQMVILER